MTLLQESWVWWAIGAAVAVPILLVILTEVINLLHARQNPAVGPLRMLRNWVIPVAALLALLSFAIQSPADRVWVRLVATVLGLLLILLVLSGFNVALFANARAGSWRERTPKIFIEIARLILVVVGLAILFSWVWSADVGGLVAALGVTSIVLGLALQNAVGGIISGLLLLFEQPFKIGDWLRVGTVSGRVVQVNWRAVHIDTGSGVEIIPNSSLAEASFGNKSRPDGPYLAEVGATFATDDPPHVVLQLLVETADPLPGRSPGRRAQARYLGAGGYAVSIPLPSPAVAAGETSRYLGWLWYAARRRGLALDGDATDPIAEPARLAGALDAVADTLQLTDRTREMVLATARLERYGPGEVVLAAGLVPKEVRFVIEGEATLAVQTDGETIPFGSAERGDYLGQSALTREPTLSVAIAADVLTVLVVPLATVDSLVRSRPTLAAEIGRSIELKRRTVAEALATAGLARGVLEPLDHA